MEGRVVPASFVVDTLSGAAPDANDNKTSLNEALAAAALTPEGDTITFAVTGNITLTTALPVIAGVGNVAINGPGADKLTINGLAGAKTFNVAFTAPATFSLSGVTISGGATAVSNSGSTNTTLNIERVEITGTSNHAITDGGIGTRITVSNSTIAQAAAGKDGINVVSSSSTLNVRQSTISGNGGSGISSGGESSVAFNVSNSTIVGNAITGITTGTGIGTTTLSSTVIARNGPVAAPLDVTGIPAAILGTSNNNFIAAIAPGSITSITNGILGNTIGQAAAPLNSGLGNLSANGGPTRTHLPLVGSPLIDKGAANSLIADQRGFARITNGIADIGAVESGSLSPQQLLLDLQNQAAISGANQQTATSQAQAAALAVAQAAFNFNLATFAPQLLRLRGLKVIAFADVNDDGFPELTFSFNRGGTKVVFQIDFVNLSNSKRLL